MIVATPNSAQSPEIVDLIQEQMGAQSVATDGTFGEIIAVVEEENVSLAEIAFGLLQTRSDCMSLAKRIHTRSDVNWTTLEDLL